MSKLFTKGRAIAAMAVLSILSASPSWAIGVTALGGLNSYGFSADPAPDSTSTQYQPAFGLLGHFGVFPLFALESGALYLGRGIESVSGDVTTESNYSALVVPVMLKFTGLPFVNVGAGLFYSKSLGEISATVTDAATDAVTEGDSSFADSGLKASDFGVAANVQLVMPFLPLVRGIVDLRLHQGLTDQAEGAGEIKNRDLSVMAGVQVAL